LSIFGHLFLTCDDLQNIVGQVPKICENCKNIFGNEYKAYRRFAKYSLLKTTDFYRLTSHFQWFLNAEISENLSKSQHCFRIEDSHSHPLKRFGMQITRFKCIIKSTIFTQTEHIKYQPKPLKFMIITENFQLSWYAWRFIWNEKIFSLQKIFGLKR
jgi:hypothetical protein